MYRASYIKLHIEGTRVLAKYRETNKKEEEISCEFSEFFRHTQNAAALRRGVVLRNALYTALNSHLFNRRRH